jgi:peroxiredoxin Q/BCP
MATPKRAESKQSDGAAALVEVGSPAPAFTLEDQTGTTRSLQEQRGRWVVLYFYPKDHTSGCTKEACQFQEATPRFKKVDAVIFGVSPDEVASHARFAEKWGLQFTLLADPEKKMLADYGVWQKKSMYGRQYLGVVRTTYLIDPKGIVAARWDKVKVPGHEDAVLDKLKELRGR